LRAYPVWNRLRDMVNRPTPGSRGVGTVEILIAAAILGLCLVPLLNLSNQTVTRARDDRARAVACLLATNALTRLGQRGPELKQLLKSGGADSGCSDPLLTGPDTLCSGDLLAVPDANEKLGTDMLKDIIKAHQISVVLFLPRAPSSSPGVNLLVCRAKWTSVVNDVKLEERVYFDRVLIDDKY
jgi:hypothetical protein